MAVHAAKYPVNPQFQKLKQLIVDIEADVNKRDAKDNHAAGVRVRKVMQEVKELAQGVRETIVQK